jgi:hypothetical protein
MKGVFCLLAATLLALAVAIPNQPTIAAGAQAANRGTIKGHVRLNGKLPGNPVIRMGMDPMCSKINAGKRVVQETVLAAADGSLANVFVKLEGSFPQTPVPTEPVKRSQGCAFAAGRWSSRPDAQVHNSDD